MSKAQSLFKLYNADKLPSENGFIVTTNFDPEGSIYSSLEIISYANVKEIVSDGESLTFRSDGHKLYILVEPFSYYQRQMEPVFRDTKKSIPYRFKELEIFTDRKNNRIMVGKQPIISLSSFSVANPEGDNYSAFIYRDKDVRMVMKDLLTDILNKDLGIERSLCRQAANYATELMVRIVKV